MGEPLAYYTAMDDAATAWRNWMGWATPVSSGAGAPVTLTPAAGPTTLIPNPRHLASTERKLARAQRVMSRRFVRGAAQQSKGYAQARARVAKLHAQLAARRTSTLHLISKRLVQQYAEIALETLNTKGMTSSAKGTLHSPGRNVRQKAGLNRAIPDAGFGELNRQITSEAAWHGASLARVPAFPRPAAPHTLRGPTTPP
ncbi:transposase [Streptomyces sp. NPDC046876]|uniref:transposase n=1 Tax=Streptomyces sp. NPDC046876 TaxID=3155616 RepID=UPI0033D1DA7C